MIMDTTNRVKALREGGEVKRCHTFPIQGEYSVASHSYGVASLVMVLFPHCRKQLIMAALTHDFHERWTGDIPSPAKNSCEQLVELLEKQEQKLDDVFDFKFDLTEDEKVILKGCDMLELSMFAKDQVYMGNKFAQRVVDKVNRWFYENVGNLPYKINSTYDNYQPERLPETIGELQ